MRQDGQPDGRYFLPHHPANDDTGQMMIDRFGGR